MLDGVIEVMYTARTLQADGDRLVRVETDCVALILLDYEADVATVSARSEQDAFSIGAAWATILGAPTIPVELNLTPSVHDEALSVSAVQMLEAAYGRLSKVGTIVNVDRIWTRRQDPAAQVQEQMARGESTHVLLDEDVQKCLLRGDSITGLAFQFDYAFKSKSGQERHFVPRVTLSSEHGPLILRVTRPGRDFELASHVFQQLRRSLEGSTPAQGVARTGEVIAQIKGS